MRFVAALLTLVALTAAALAGQGLWQEVKDPPAVAIPAAVIHKAEPQPPAAALPPRNWPALFGEPQPPLPPQPEPQPPAPVAEAPASSMPPLDSLGYTLKGLVRSEGAIWALVSHPGGDRVLRPGEDLEDGYTVKRIDSAGLWVTDGTAEPALLGFTREE